MPRANRHYIPGCVWHITHRCHKQEFLFKFNKDKERWRHWLFEAKKRYGLCVLNYIVTSNHIHLLVVDTGEDVIPSSLQLLAGRTAQEYNQRKNRKGAFWEDRYHATAVQTDEHLAKCLVYIDLNMVRAGAVKHPSEYPLSGYHEIQNPPKRYSVVDTKRLMNLFAINDQDRLRSEHRHWVEQELLADTQKRNELWSTSTAVGDKGFVEKIKQQLKSRAANRLIVTDAKGITALREDEAPYSTIFRGKKHSLRLENTYLWKTNG